ncbi:MAG: hypothetical protein ACRD2Z_04545 [Thermoanaerobaculia bacterium]
MSRPIRWSAVAALLLAVAGHVGWWYWPRLHRATPGGLTGALLTAEGLEDTVWIAHPHQNLARLESRTGDVSDLAARVATLLDSDPPAWPRFAFWPVPPARSLAWARSRDGAGEIVALEPYPVVRWLVRAAGRLADNPWLAGGTVGEGDRAARVLWREGTWILERGSLTQALGSRESGAGEESGVDRALAWVRLGPGHDPWPQGLYRAQAIPRGVELVSGAPPSSRTREAARPLQQRSVLLAIAAPPGGAGAMALLRPRGSGGDLALPGALLVQRGDSGLELPGARLLDAIGLEPHERAEGDFQILAWDRGSLTLGGELTDVLRPAGPEEALPRLAVWADLEEVAAWAETLGGALRVVPFIDPEPARRWLALAALARAAGPDTTLWAEIHDSPDSARILLLRREPRTVLD